MVNAAVKPPSNSMFTTWWQHKKEHIDNQIDGIVQVNSFIFSEAIMLAQQIACKMETHLVAADVIITLIDTATVRPKFQGLSH